MPKITEILFDCDNTLVMSEDLAFEAVADVINNLLKEKNIPDRYTGPGLLTDFVGQNFRGILKSLQAKYGFQITPEQEEHLVKEEENQVVAKLQEKGQPCEGVMAVLDKLYTEKKYDMAVVSSSALRRVVASIKKTGQDKFFAEHLVFSAATSLPKPTTKPDPAIYLHAMKVVGKKPEECVAVEDSKSGALSAIRARIPVIAYVGSYETEEKRKEMAKALLDLGAKVVMYHWSEFEKCIAEIENQPETVSAKM
ncbi:hypothetical protein KEM56_001485 [Ascosphaera pollenicola]|nr:hypothetical protein KEM56_001485 [Ascosphaera pollenicola]